MFRKHIDPVRWFIQMTLPYLYLEINRVNISADVRCLWSELEPQYYSTFLVTDSTLCIYSTLR